jgi:hypothetical protein
MGQGFNTDMMDDLGTDEDEYIPGNEPDFATQFRESLPEDQRAEFDRTFIPKSDLTRMRQKDTATVRTLEERLSRIETGVSQSQQSRGNGNGNGAPDEIQSLLDKHGIDAEKAGPFREMMQEFAHSVTKQAVNATIGQMSPFINGVTNDVHARNLSQAKQTLTSNLGKGVEKLWPDVEEKCRQELQEGRPVDPEFVLRQLYPEDYYNLVASAQSRKRRQVQQQSQSQGMEGMVSQRRTKVFPEMGGRDTKDTVPKGINPAELTASVLKEMRL